MEKAALLPLLEDFPIIPAVKNEAGMKKCVESENPLVFVLHANLSTAAPITAKNTTMPETPSITRRKVSSSPPNTAIMVVSRKNSCTSARDSFTVREAAMAPSEEVPVDETVGRIAAVSRISCPPGIPVVCAGEEIGEEEKILPKNSGIFSIFVIK